MKLRHYTYDPLTRVRNTRQYRDGDGREHWRHLSKPIGLWVSDESEYGWRKWAKDNRFRPHGFKYEYEIKLKPKAKILYLRNAEDIEKFALEYVKENSAANDIGKRVYEEMKRDHPSYSRERPDIMEIDWYRVAKKYAGIIITPYIWEQRLSNNSWYYTWDCASGCIWNAGAIESFELVRERKVPRRPTRAEYRRKHKRDIDKLRKATADLQDYMRKEGMEIPESIEVKA